MYSSLIFVIAFILILVYESPNSIVRVILMYVLLLLFIIVIERDNRERYDYNSENPRALTYGENVAGTVFTSEPENSPGLGWIL